MDLDGSQHLIYDNLEWTSDDREFAVLRTATWHPEGELLLTISTMNQSKDGGNVSLAEMVASVISLAEKVLADQGKAALWLCCAVRSSGGMTPMNLILTHEGAQRVLSRLWQIDEGV